MQRVNIDVIPPEAKDFVLNLANSPGGVELESKGKVIGKFIGPNQLTDAEREAILEAGWKLVQATQARNAHVPADVIEREVEQAIEEVRRRKPT